MQLFSVNHYGTITEVQIGDSMFSLTEAELRRLRSGQQLPNNHPLHQAVVNAASREASLVMYTHPLMAKAGPPQKFADDFAFTLQQAYPEYRIYRDPYSPQTPVKVKALNEFKTASASDLVAVIADDSFQVKDYRIIQNVKDELASAGIKTIRFTGTEKPEWRDAGGKAMIVIKGHIDVKLANFVRELGDKGYFTNNFVVFNSCRAPLTRILVDEINSKYGAVATFTYDKKIDTSAVEDSLAALSERLKENQDINFVEALQGSVREAKMNGIWTICTLAPEIMLKEDLFHGKRP